MKFKRIAIIILVLINVGCTRIDKSKNQNVSNSTISDNILEEDNTIIKQYENFLDDKEKTVITNEYQNFDVIEWNDIFEKGEKYSLSEIVERVHEASDLYDETKETEICSRYIDCGQDGEKELLVSIYMPGAWSEGYNIKFILKEVDKELQVLYFGEGWDTDSSFFRISDNGYISKGGRGSDGVLVVENGYLDSDVNWHFYYGYFYYMDMYSFVKDVVREKVADYVPNGDKDIDVHSDEWENVQVKSYYFIEEDVRKFENQKYVYWIYDNDGNLVLSTNDKDSARQKKFEEWGIEMCTDEDIDALLKNKREEIGLDDTIIE